MPAETNHRRNDLGSAETMSRDLVDYYRRRAGEYDEVYAKPERRGDIEALELRIRALLADKAVLEVATGTAFWTAAYADEALSVLATDINREVLDIAKTRREWPATVEFRLADAFTLRQLPGRFDAVFVGFFWSHVARTRPRPIPGSRNRTFGARSAGRHRGQQLRRGEQSPRDRS